MMMIVMIIIILAAHIKWDGRIPYPIPSHIPSHLPKSHPNPKSQSHPNPKSQIPSHIPINLIGRLSRDVTQTSKKGNFASRKKWEILVSQVFQKRKFIRRSYNSGQHYSHYQNMSKIKIRTDLRRLYFNSGQNYKLPRFKSLSYIPQFLRDLPIRF